MGRETISAAAALALRCQTVVRVVITCAGGLVAHARAVADSAGVAIRVDLMAATVRVRFDGRPTA
jgi:hypothetical protein